MSEYLSELLENIFMNKGKRIEKEKERLGIDLFKAAATGDLANVKTLFEQKEPHRNFDTACFISVRGGHFEVGEFLISKGGNVFIVNDLIVKIAKEEKREDILNFLKPYIIKRKEDLENMLKGM